jgi:CheY-like chemotaxis protein
MSPSPPVERRKRGKERPPHICVVEDYAVHARMVSSILGYAGMEVTTAANGPILESMLDQGLRPDLFLVDLVLPGESGIEVMRKLRRRPRWAKAPIIACSAFSAREHRKEAIRLGFDDFIEKPLDLAVFTRTVRGFFPDWKPPARVI